MTSSVALPSTSSLTRPANRLGVVGPTFRPKPRNSVGSTAHLTGTSFGLLRGDTIQPCWMRAAPTVTLDDLQAWRDVPKPTSKAV